MKHTVSRQTKSSLLYLALLFLGGICHVLDNLADHYFVSTWLFCTDLMLYMTPPFFIREFLSIFVESLDRITSSVLTKC